MFQDYESEEQEYADGIADNTIDKWAELDLSSIQNDVAEFPNFNIDLLGIKEFSSAEFGEVEINEKELDENIHTDKECPSCGYKW